MEIKAAIQSIANGSTFISSMAKTALETDKGILDFVGYISDQFYENNQIQTNLAINHGWSIIDCIIKYGKMINAQAESICMSKCIAEDLNSSDDNIN